MRRVIAVIGIGLALTFSARAQDEPVTIKLKMLEPGEAVRDTVTERTTTRFTVSVMGMEQVKSESKSGWFVRVSRVKSAQG